MIKTRCLWVSLLLVLLSCAKPAEKSGAVGKLSVHEIAVPAGAGAKSPHLLADGDRFVLSWYEPVSGKNFALKFATSGGETWSAPTRVLESDRLQLHPSVLSSAAYLSGGSVLALWDQIELEKEYSEGIYAAGSRDDGVKWTPAGRVNRDIVGEHSYVSMAPAGVGQALAVWLNFVPGAEEKAQLMSALIGSDGRPGAQTVLDDDVCNCCPTSLARTENGFVVAYRDHTPGDIRDISTAVYKDKEGAWSKPRPASQDGWSLKGCPTNGPSVAAQGREVALAWFTAPDETSQVRLAISKDEAMSFNAPLRIDDGRPSGYASVALLGKQTLVSWIERAENGTELRLKRVGADGKLSPAVVVAKGYKLGHPNLRRAGNQVMVCWTEARDEFSPTAIHTALIEAD